MFASVPLLSRLRHRSLGAVWLCALLIVLKVAVATGCLATDALVAPAALASQTMQVDDDVRMAADDHTTVADECWHADIGDCHCSCMHAVPLTGDADLHVAMQAPASIFVGRLPALRAPPAQNELRPPIA